MRGLFLLAKATASDLESAALAGGACLIAATAMGGRFASTEMRASTSSPATAGSPAWSRRWRANGPRSVAAWSTFLRDAPRETIAAQLADEMFVSDGFPEIGYEGDRRIRLRSVASPLVRTGAGARAQARRARS